MKEKNRILRKFAAVLMAVFSLSLLSPEVAAHLGTVQTVQAAVKISSKKLTMVKGQKKTLKVTGTSKKAKWTSSKKSVASVTQKGVVTAKKKGTTTITAKIGSKKYTCKVTVETPKLNRTSVSLNKNKTYQLKMSGTTLKAKWTSSNKAVATVSSKGKVTAKGAGTATVTANINGVKYNCKVTVKGSSSTSSTSNFQRLRNYISANGGTNKYGEPVLNYSYKNEDGDFLWAIVRDNTGGTLTFIVTSEYDGGEKCSLTMKVVENPSVTNPEFLIISTTYNSGFQANASLNPKTYTGKKNINFNITGTYGETAPYATMNNLANSTLQLGFAGWEVLLEKAGMNFKSIGFSAYAG